MVMETVLQEIRKSYMAKKHPTIENAIIVYNINLKEASALCKRHMCSGSFHDWDKIAILTNFGKYKS